MTNMGICHIWCGYVIETQLKMLNHFGGGAYRNWARFQYL